MEMEALVVVRQHRNQYYSRNKCGVRDRFCSPSSRGFRDIYCRFQSGAGILPTPLMLFNDSLVDKETFSSSTAQGPVSPHRKAKKLTKYNGKSNGIPIAIKSNNRDWSFDDDLSCSKLWAGPAYSNSPPPSSLPMPKFSLLQKQCVSPQRIVPTSGMPSLTGEPDHSSSNVFLCTDSATKNLRRILHLDIGDESE